MTWVKRGLLGLLVLALIGGVLAGGVLAGYYVHAWQASPLADLIPRIERKVGSLRGEPSELEKNVAKIETTFVQLRGRVMRPPGSDWINGGALTVRGGEILTMDRRGRFHATDGENPLRRLSELVAPDNGFDAYAAFAASPEGAAFTHIVNRLRFNDVTWIETPSSSGLALSYTFFDTENRCHGTRIAWADAQADGPLAIAATDWRVLFETTPCLPMNTGRPAIDGQMAGGRMAFEAPATLYLGSGDYHLDGIHTYDIGIQSEDTSYGKVIAIDLESGESRIVSKGHRNLQGVALTPDGRLFVTEHGIRGGDELNLVIEGGNYGWPDATLGTLYSGQPVPDITFGRHDAGRPPVFAWLPSAAISSLMAIDGIDPAWDGDLLAGSLSSPEFGQSLWHIRVRGERAEFVERIQLNERIRYVTQFGDQIAVWLDTNDLVLFDVTRRADPLKNALAYLKATYEPAIVEQVGGILSSCNECHSFAQNEQRGGPSLNGVVGRSVASTAYSAYSDALRAMDGKWTAERLATFLADPQEVAPGTSMPGSGLVKGAVMDALIDTLGQVDSKATPDLTYN